MTEPVKIAFGDQGPLSLERPTWCGGAVLRVDRDGYRELERSGIRWATRSVDIPADRPGDARVVCRDEAMSKIVDGRRYYYALCAACSGLEVRHREALRARAGAK